MAITIQELLASDTVSQATDKINFNFDQLLLNGGGAPGPQGPAGPQGPIGGRGLRGSKWYEDPNATATNPNTLIFADVEIEDNYLDANGDVWTYNGTVWVKTSVSLQGPQGAAGVSAGFDYFGFPLLSGEQSIYPTVMPTGAGAGATTANEGIPTVVLGAVPSTATPVTGIPFTSAYKLSDTLAQNLESDVTAVLIHQKDTSTSAIKFAGGGAITGEKLEQIDINNLTSIGLGFDDRLVITVPKLPTTPGTVSDLIGYELNTLFKSQSFYAGKAISFSTGNDSTVRLASEISDFTITVNTANPSTPGKFNVRSTATASTALFEVGGNITLPSSTTRTGKILLDAGNISSVARLENQVRGETVFLGGGTLTEISSQEIHLNGGGATISGSELIQLVSDNGIRIETQNNDITILSDSNIDIDADEIYINTSSDLIVGSGGVINISANNEIELRVSDGSYISLLQTGAAATDAEIRLDYGTTSHVALKGRLTWGWNSLQTPGGAFWDLNATSAGSTEPTIRVINNSSNTAVSFRTQSQAQHFTDIRPVGIHSYGTGAGNDYFKVDSTQVHSGKPVNYKKQEYSWNPAASVLPIWTDITTSFATWKVGPFGSGTGSSSVFNQTVVLPDGSFNGQRLTIRLVNLPFTQAILGSGTGMFYGTFNIAGKNYSGTSNTVLVTATSDIGTTDTGQDVVADLVWMDGLTLTSTAGIDTYTVYGGWRVISTVTHTINP